jgi:hypothetical protein
MIQETEAKLTKESLEASSQVFKTLHKQKEIDGVYNVNCPVGERLSY